MSDLPADPFRTGDVPTDAIHDGAILLGALDSITDTDGARDLLRAVFALDEDDVRGALIVALIERHAVRRTWLRRRIPRVLRRRSFRTGRGPG